MTTAAPSGGETAAPVEHPGRWLGGAIGAAASLVAALVAAMVTSRLPVNGPTSLTSDWTEIGLLGAPVGFALGRQLLPTARSGGWGTALLTGVGLGLIAPPMGALEILMGWAFVPTNGVGGAPGVGILILLPFAIPFSYVAVVMTVPVGVAWAVGVRAVPARLLQRLEAPAWLAAFGVRHVAALTIVALIALVVTRPLGVR